MHRKHFYFQKKKNFINKKTLIKIPINIPSKLFFNILIKVF